MSKLAVTTTPKERVAGNHRQPTHQHDEPSQCWTVNDILRHFGPAYLRKYRSRMPSYHLKVLRDLSGCRQPESGWILYFCRQCGGDNNGGQGSSGSDGVHHTPKACGNRHCCDCQGAKARQWLARQLECLLPCAYFMLTFTVPKEIRRFVRSHPEPCYGALLESAYAAMTKLAADPKRLGSPNIGATAVLHTWGRDMCYHPHAHFLVPGGALSKTGDHWRSSSADFFLPVKALSKIFRAKFKQRMQDCGLLHQIDPACWQKGWNVNSKAVGDGRTALKYLAPYVYRVAIGNFRIQSVVANPDGTGLVTYLFKPSGTEHYLSMTVSAEVFLQRFLQHSLPKGFKKVRHFGFLSKRSKQSVSRLQMLVTITLNMVYTLIVTPQAKALSKPSQTCPDCGSPLQCLGFGRQALEKLNTIRWLQQQACIDTS